MVPFILGQHGLQMQVLIAAVGDWSMCTSCNGGICTFVLAMNVLAQMMMKNAAKCDMHCELQNSVNQ